MPLDEFDFGVYTEYVVNYTNDCRKEAESMFNINLAVSMNLMTAPSAFVRLR